jgi:hypothetical protein
MTAVYLYGFVPAGGLDDFAHPGIEPGRDVAAEPFGDLAALVSAVTPGLVAPASDTPTAEEQTRIVGQAVRHQEVIAAAFARCAVLPVRYGAVFSAREKLAALVGACRSRIADFLTTTADRDEWAVKGHLHTQRAVDHLLAADAELAAQRERLPAAPGARYFQERKLHAEAERRVHARLADVLVGVRAELAVGAEAVCELRRTAPADGGQRFVYHDAFLVPRARAADWLGRLDAVAARVGAGGLSLAATGPWPPASFAPHLDAPT